MSSDEPKEAPSITDLTPKGVFIGVLISSFGVSMVGADEAWELFGGILMKQLREIDPDASYAGIVFDGNGGQLVGMEQAENGEEEA
jgi:hypothetical protein